MRFPTKGAQQSWELDQARVDVWQSQYPKVDVVAECLKALAWCEANPQRRKSAPGMPRFLNAWLSRSTHPVAIVARTAGIAPRQSHSWHDECKTRHGFACGSAYDHDVRMTIEAARREREHQKQMGLL